MGVLGSLFGPIPRPRLAIKLGARKQLTSQIISLGIHTFRFDLVSARPTPRSRTPVGTLMMSRLNKVEEPPTQVTPPSPKYALFPAAGMSHVWL